MGVNGCQTWLRSQARTCSGVGFMIAAGPGESRAGSRQPPSEGGVGFAPAIMADGAGGRGGGGGAGGGRGGGGGGGAGVGGGGGAGLGWGARGGQTGGGVGKRKRAG